MTTQKLALGIGCLLVAACGTLPPAASAPDTGLDMRLDPPPVHALLGYRAQLQLTSEQIDALDALGQEAHAENHPLLTELNNAEQSCASLESQHRILTLASEIHRNNLRAMERVRGVLTERQSELTCDLFAGSRFKSRGLRTIETTEIATRGMQRSGSAVTVGTQASNGAVWSWCDETLPNTAAR
jgi:hypothetical protein